MSADRGYVKLYRDIQNHWIWQDPEKLRAWIDIIMTANHEDKKVLFDGNLIIVKRGTFITSIRKLAKRWGWGRDTVSRFLRTLEQDAMLATKSDTKKTLIIVENYGVYQSDKKPKSDTNKATDKATDKAQTNTKEYTNETLKKKDPFCDLEEDDEIDTEGWSDA